ncbi:hypothetical protein JTB14_014387 [Gonioctena quinquepunctata]|nr:hypothetical protein JTB14_014387 [Gonioctena quinquepunctata]
MGRLLMLAVACALVSQYAQGDKNVKLGKEPEPIEKFELREGNCSKAIIGDLVFQDHVHLWGVPFISRNTTSSWQGDPKIYCILALSQKDITVGSTIFVKDGGVNHTYVTLEMHSKKNNGLEYNIQIFGK